MAEGNTKIKNQEENLSSSPSFRKDAQFSISNLEEFSVCEEDDFEFAVSFSDSSITADEMFSNGKLLPVYPVFNRNLLNSNKVDNIDNSIKNLIISDLRSGSTSSSSSLESSEEVEELPVGSYCVWAPRSAPQSPERCKKSASTGTGSKRWRLRDLMVGRSRSDGKEKYVFLNPNPIVNTNAETKTNETTKKGDGNSKKVREMDMVTAHRLFYSKEGRKAKRSFLPYRPELVGLFAGNGTGRGFPHPQ